MIGWHDTPWMWLSMVVFWSLFGVLAFYAVKGLTRRTGTQSRPQATEILEQRYARGEISAEEYAERRKTLAATATRSS